MAAFTPPAIARHEHVIAERPLFRGLAWTRPYCAHCGLTLAACLRESGAAISRLGFERVRFTCWSRDPAMGAA
jgi:hypothetical protein